MSNPDDLTYDAAMEELQTIVAELQEDLLSMDHLSQKAERAAFLIRWCQSKLRQTEDSVNAIFEEKGDF